MPGRSERRYSLYVDLLHTMRIVDPQMKDQALLDAFGRRIRELRTGRGLSHEELADPNCG